MAEVAIAEWNTDNPKGCRMPEAMIPQVATICYAFRKMHCSEKRASHDCSGRIITDCNGMTLQCPLCGDERSTYPAPPAIDAAQPGRE